jgi:hypothetical protein
MTCGHNNNDMKLKHVINRPVILFIIQMLFSITSFGLFIWGFVQYLKRYFISELALFSWTDIFYHPFDSNMINYIIVCIILGFLWMLIYFFANGRVPKWFLDKIAGIKETHLIVFIAVSMGLVLLVAVSNSLKLQIVCSFIVTIFPLILFIPIPISKETAIKTSTVVLASAAAVFFLLASYEIFSIVHGPAHLMNEFPEIYSNTKMNPEGLSVYSTAGNMDFLVKMSAQYTTFFQDSFRPSEFDYFPKNLFINYDLSVGNKAILNETKEFYLKNLIEYMHQNNGRGQLNHLGHILNPINEMESGRPIKEIYFQYGLGNTLIFKYIMDFFGGVSIQNYYKTYIVYFVYFVFFFFMLIYLFKDVFYVSACMLILIICFFFNRYVPLILAPGIMPSIHLFDALIIITMISYFRKNSIFSLYAALLMSLLSIVINPHFGIAISVAVMAALFVYMIENRKGKNLILFSAGLLFAFLLMVSLFIFFNVSTANHFAGYMFNGFLSWPPKRITVVFAVAYLICSYLLLILMKREVYFIKYVYMVVFFYAQILLIYYFWSGIINHLIPIFPFIFLQLMIMAYILFDDGRLNGINLRQQFVHIMKPIVSITLIAVVFFSVSLFYYGVLGKKPFMNNFSNHGIFHWNFKRANLISTANPEPIEKGILLIRKYSSDDNPGIFIISKYDNILPFLANRYSMMPIFDLSSYLFSQKEVAMAVNVIKKNRPAYLFADADVFLSKPDMWSTVYSDDFFEKEKNSRYERYIVLAEVFNQVKNDYEKIEETQLLALYKRK